MIINLKHRLAVKAIINTMCVEIRAADKLPASAVKAHNR